MARKDDTITSNVKQYRLKRGWSQEELAQQVDVRRQAIYDIETGRYLPNTAIALRMARLFACRVEDLFVVAAPPDSAEPVHVVNGEPGPSRRLALGRVREQLVGFPLQGAESISFGLRPADGLLSQDGKNARIFLPTGRLEKTLLLMGCDPAFEILGAHVARIAPEARIHCRFASSLQALGSLGAGWIHVAGTHLHNTGKKESNVVVAAEKLGGMRSRVLGFSILEEGLMVARDNPLGIRSVSDLAQPMVRFVNREPGAALRVLLDDQLRHAGVAPGDIGGYGNEVGTHREGAYRIACRVADAALGLKAVADAFSLGFVPITTARCDLVVPIDMEHHPTIKILLDVLQSSALRQEIDAIPGYEASVTGKRIAEL